MIHIVQVLSDTNIGGAGKYLINYLKCFNRQTYTVTVVLPENSKLLPYIRSFDDIFVIEAPHMADQSFNKWAVSFLKDLFINIKPNIVHSHACLSARIAAKKARVPVVLATRHCIEPIPCGIKALALGLANNHLCDYYIAVSDAVVNNLKDCGVKPGKIKLVNNGVEPVDRISDAEIAAIRGHYNINPKDIVFGIFARLEPVKGHKYFIRAAQQVLEENDNAKFLIVGNGSLETYLRDITKQYGIEKNVIFTGFVTDTTELLNAADINVNASQSEAMSLSILEAMSLGKPSIATNVGGNGELIEDEKTGLLIDYADSSSLAYAMKKLMQDSQLSAILAKNAKEKFDTCYTVQKMVSRLEEVYEEVLSNDH
ncbi:MAG: glycosyltransferase family 4 protein [Ruminococcaceae bacterium]|nr:glycosyltransferase family 4 protein [Oscillospiraceae bacterium]